MNLTLRSLLLISVAGMVTGPVRGEPPVRLLPADEELEIRRMLPTVDDKNVQSLLNARDLIWYTDREMPRAYQFQNTFHDPAVNVAKALDKFGNGNQEFPWSHAGGAHEVKNLAVYRFLQLPKRPSGGYWPIGYYRATLPGSTAGEALKVDSQGRLLVDQNNRYIPGEQSTHAWIFPRGTVFGELMCQVVDDLVYPFELRLRYRMSTFWEVDAFRPFPTADSLIDRLKADKSDWWADTSYVSLLKELSRKSGFEEEVVTDRNPTRRAFNPQSIPSLVHKLPPIDKQLAADLITRTIWTTATGAPWKTLGGGRVVYAPTVEEGAGLHIVPEGYKAHAFTVDSQSCMQCHEHAGVAVRTFDLQRAWYGRNRGSDGIFSFHPIDPASISPNGYNREVRLRPEFLEAGIVERFDSDKHLPHMYTRIKEFR